MLIGYNNHATQLGYQKKGAVPSTEAEMQLLLQSLATTCSNSDTDAHERLLLLRDGMLFSLLWQLCFRGFNAGSLRLDNIALPTGESALPYVIPDMQLHAGAVLHLLPDTTKNETGGHNDSKFTLSYSSLILISYLFPKNGHFETFQLCFFL